MHSTAYNGFTLAVYSSDLLMKLLSTVESSPLHMHIIDGNCVIAVATCTVYMYNKVGLVKYDNYNNYMKFKHSYI